VVCGCVASSGCRCFAPRAEVVTVNLLPSTITGSRPKHLDLRHCRLPDNLSHLVGSHSSLNVNSVVESLRMVITLFDKSFLQSLSLDEAVLFDNFFYPNISPIFFVETLADLAKDLQDRTSEREVQIIADKTPQLHGGPNMFHGTLCLGELLGHNVNMTGQIVVPSAPLVSARGRTGVVHKEPPEREAFSRWQDGQFTEVERRFAKVWREVIAAKSTRNDNTYTRAMLKTRCLLRMLNRSIATTHYAY